MPSFYTLIKIFFHILTRTRQTVVNAIKMPYCIQWLSFNSMFALLCGLKSSYVPLMWLLSDFSEEITRKIVGILIQLEITSSLLLYSLTELSIAVSVDSFTASHHKSFSHSDVSIFDSWHSFVHFYGIKFSIFTQKYDLFCRLCLNSLHVLFCANH